MQEVILVKLGEIVLKGLNRRTFEDRLLKNIRRRIARAGNFEVYSMQSTIYIEPKDEDADIDEAEERISKIFGVIGYARACVCEKDMDAITKMAPEYLNDTLAGFKTFKVESKRADKKFPLGSMEISREVGAALLRANPHISVDVHNPEITVRVEIREKAAHEGRASLFLKRVFSVFQRTSSDFVRAEPALDGVRYHIPADAFFSLAGYAGGYKAFVHVKYKLRYVFRFFPSLKYIPPICGILITRKKRPFFASAFMSK